MIWRYKMKKKAVSIAVEEKFCYCGNILGTDQEQRDEICRDCI